MNEKLYVALQIWFVISAFVMLYLALKVKDLKRENEEFPEDDMEELNKMVEYWDKDYRDLVERFGTIENYVELHDEDFNLIRNYLVNQLVALRAVARGETGVSLNVICDNLENFIYQESVAHAKEEEINSINTLIEQIRENFDISSIEEISKKVNDETKKTEPPKKKRGRPRKDGK